jgi:hypothetical protein
MRGLSPKIISGDSQRSENAQKHHVQAYSIIYEVQLDLLQNRFKYNFYIRMELQKLLQRINNV